MAARLVIRLISLRPMSGWTSWMQFVMMRCRMALLLLASLPPCNFDERQEIQRGVYTLQVIQIPSTQIPINLHLDNLPAWPFRSSQQVRLEIFEDEGALPCFNWKLARSKFTAINATYIEASEKQFLPLQQQDETHDGV